MANSSFAHLLPTAEVPEPERDGPRPGPDDDSGKGKKGRKKAATEPEDEKDDNDEGEGEGRPRSRKKAQNISLNFYAAEPEDEKDDEDESRGNQGRKKAWGKPKEKRSESNDVDDDDEDEEDEKEARARASESRRWQKIMSHPTAQRNPAFAAKLAAMPNLSSSQVIEILEESGSPISRPDRSARNPTIGGSSGAPGRTPAPGGFGTMEIQSSWDHAFKLARTKIRPIGG
jgi:hypothetical protein